MQSRSLGSTQDQDQTSVESEVSPAGAREAPIRESDTKKRDQAGATLRTEQARGMSPGTQAKMEQAFGADFSSVRLVANSPTPAALGAEAFAQGEEIHFAPGRWNDGSEESHALLGHELTHVIQQRQGRVQAGPQTKRGALGGVNDDGGLETEADVAGARAARGQAVPSSSSGAGTRAVHSGGEGAPMQLYSKIRSSPSSNPQFGGGTWRVADDGKMAVEDSVVGDGGHRMWASADVIAHSAGVLQGIASPYSIAAGGQTITIDAPDGSGQVTLHEVVVTNSSNNTSGDNLLTKENCDENTGDFLGQDRRVMDFGVQLADGTFIDKGKQGPGAEVRKLITGENDTAKGMKAYDKMSDKQRHAMDAQLGINSAAAPTVGQGITVYQGGQKAGATGFGFHFAPVLANSGGDYVTMENHGRGTKTGSGGAAASNQWYLRMYGPVKQEKGLFGRKKTVDQSFHAEQEKSKDVGEHVITMVVEGREPQSKQECIAKIVEVTSTVAKTVSGGNGLENQRFKDQDTAYRDLQQTIAPYVKAVPTDTDVSAIVSGWLDTLQKAPPITTSTAAQNIVNSAISALERALKKLAWLEQKMATFN